jgi:hypothetical protein
MLLDEAVVVVMIVYDMRVGFMAFYFGADSGTPTCR